MFIVIFACFFIKAHISFPLIPKCFKTEQLINQGKNIVILCLCIGENNAVGRSYDGDSVNISDCFFTRMSQYNSAGGVIFISDTTKTSYISNCMFNNCATSTDYGGAIFLTLSMSFMKMVCANRCSSQFCHFAWVKATLSNEAVLLSMTECSYTTNGDYSVCFSEGNPKVDFSNCSRNYAHVISGIYFYKPSTSSSSVMCTFSNNVVSAFMCIDFYSCSGTMSYACVVNNNSPAYGIVYVSGSGTHIMEYCLFISNDNTLFHVDSGSSLTIKHSFIYHLNSIKSGIINTENNNTNINHPTYIIPYFKSHYCHADNSLAVHIKQMTSALTFRSNIILLNLLNIFI